MRRYQVYSYGERESFDQKDEGKFDDFDEAVSRARSTVYRGRRMAHVMRIAGPLNGDILYVYDQDEHEYRTIH